MAERIISVEDTAALYDESNSIIKDCEHGRECVARLRKAKEDLALWQSAEKDRAFESIDKMIAKFEKLLDMTESYGKVGVQSARVTDAAEEAVKDLNNKFANYLN